MTQRYVKLTNDWLLRGWSDVPFALVEWRQCNVRPLSQKGAYVAKSCDGKTDFNSLLFMPDHVAILGRFIEQGLAEECTSGDMLADHQRLRKAPNPYLTGIHWSVTGRCNLNCRHCYIEAPDLRYADVSPDAIRRLIDQFERANVLQVSITGGEPFLRDDLMDIVGMLLDRKIRVHQFYTNGLLVTDAVLSDIKALGMTPAFHLSFDGCGVHDRMRGTQGTEGKVLDAIRRIGVAGFPVTVATSIDRGSKECLAETYERMKELEVQSWQVAPPNQTGNWCGVTTGLSHDEEAALYTPLLRRWHDDGRPFRLQLGALFNSLIDAVGEHQPKRQVRHTPDTYDCGVCRQTPYLLPDGTLLPCHGFTGTSLQDEMPNLLKQELSEVWTDSRLRTISQAKKGERLQHNEECAECELFERCGMGCRARALIEAGDIETKDPLTCELWREGYKERLLQSVGGSR